MDFSSLCVRVFAVLVFYAGCDGREGGAVFTLFLCLSVLTPLLSLLVALQCFSDWEREEGMEVGLVRVDVNVDALLLVSRVTCFRVVSFPSWRSFFRSGACVRLILVVGEPCAVFSRCCGRSVFLACLYQCGIFSAVFSVGDMLIEWALYSGTRNVILAVSGAGF